MQTTSVSGTQVIRRPHADLTEPAARVAAVMLELSPGWLRVTLTSCGGTWAIWDCESLTSQCQWPSVAQHWRYLFS